MIVIDTETSGLDRGSRLLSLAAINPATGERREWTCNPGMPIPAEITAINGHTDDEVKDCPYAGEVLREFFAWLPDKTLVIHNASYDVGILNWEAGRFGIPIPEGLYTICTLEIAKAIKATKRNNLDALVEHYQITRCGESHRALSDADACMQYFERVKDLQPLSPTPWEYAGHDYQYCDPPFGLDKLVATGQPFTFGYEDKGGDKTERTIIPHGWCQRHDVTYFHGHCLLREARREFRADRVTLLETV